MTAREFLGADERALAAELAAQLPEASPSLTWNGVDLRSSAEHLLYVALRQPSVPAHGRLGRARALARLGREALRSIRTPRPRARDATDLAVLVTQPVHATLFAPIAERIPDRITVSVVDARTGARSVTSLPAVDDRLTAYLDRTHIPALAAHALVVQRQLATPPDGWLKTIGRNRGERLAGILRRGLPLVALDAARIAAFIDRRRPAVIVCFSESGLLARIVPAVAARRDGIAVVDLPHAEAADPWGTAGVTYDGIAVYGPRAAEVMARAGIPDERVTQVGPLRYDGILARPPMPPVESPRRIVLASQPGDPTKRAVHPDVKRAVLRAALAASGVLGPAELRIVPHPTESDRINEELLADAELPHGVEVVVEQPGALHDVLPGAWLLITGASQSVYDAVLSGVPAITVNATGGEDPVGFARDNIALGAESVEETVALARRLSDPDRRRDAVTAARAAIGERLGPLDGRAADRTAEWLMGFVGERRGP